MDYCISDEANNWDNWDLDIFQEDDWEDLNPFEEDMMEANNTDISWADLYWDDNTCWDDTCCDVLETTIDCGPGYHGYCLHHQRDIWDCQMLTQATVLIPQHQTPMNPSRTLISIQMKTQTLKDPTADMEIRISRA